MSKFKICIKTLLVAAILGCGSSAAYAEPAETTSQTLSVSQPQIRVVNGVVEITVPGDEDRDVAIYALTGQIVRSLRANPGVTTVELPKGYYIVKCDRVSSRVIIK